MKRNDLQERPERREELAGWYAELLEAQASSGLSMADYAAEVGVTAGTLYQWKRRLADYAEFETPRSLGLVEVSVKRGPSERTASPFVVRLGDRCVEVPQQFDDEDLIRLIGVLESC